MRFCFTSLARNVITECGRGYGCLYWPTKLLSEGNVARGSPACDGEVWSGCRSCMQQPSCPWTCSMEPIAVEAARKVGICFKFTQGQQIGCNKANIHWQRRPLAPHMHLRASLYKCARPRDAGHRL